ncbi:MAG: phospholipase [Candidatus Dormibacter sp.]
MSDTLVGRAADSRAPSTSAQLHDEAAAEECASVLVEVGGDRGALVLYLDEGYRHHEVEISPVGSPHRVHTGVRDRPTAVGTVLAAVFGSLAAGSYVVWRPVGTAAATVVVTAGRVTEWRSDRQ